MTQFALDSKSKLQNLLATVPPQIADRYFALESGAQAASAAANAKTARLRSLRDEKMEIESRKGRTLREFRKLGNSLVVGEGPNEKPHPLLAGIDGELKLIDRKIAEAEAAPIPGGVGLGAANDFLHRLPPGVELEAAELPEVKLPKGANFGDYYAAEVKKLESIRKEGKDLWALPPDQATVRARIDRAVADAANPVKLGGLLRAFYDDEQGRRHADHPSPKPQIPRELIGRGIGDVLAVDSWGILCALFPDQIKADLRQQYENEFADAKTISPVEKHKRVQVLKTREWDQLVLVEEIYLAATKSGFVLDRLPKIPAEILLGCKKTDFDR